MLFRSRINPEQINHFNQWLDEQGFPTEDGGQSLLLKRTIETNSRSRAFINGSVATLAQLREAGDQLVDIHGQHAHQLLLKGENKLQFPHQIYLSWQPAWGSYQIIPEMIPGQRWKLKVKLKRPYGSLNPYTFDFERWSFHQNFGASGSVKSGELLQMKEIGLLEFALQMELARYKLRKKIKTALSPDTRYAGVIIALVMGDQNEIGRAHV